MKQRNLSLSALALVALSGIALVGCGPEVDLASDVPPPLRNLEPAPALAADAGVPVQVTPDPTFERTRQVAQTTSFGRRSDPFALLGPEAAFERAQQMERVQSEFGGFFPTLFEEPAPSPEETIVVEPQPYRRLAGVLLGNGVAALIQMEDGRVFEIVPGSVIPGTNWVVISIDAERAILRRPGNRLPKEIIVRLGPRAENFMGGGGDTGGRGAGQADGGASPDGAAGAGGGRGPGAGARRGD